MPPFDHEHPQRPYHGGRPDVHPEGVRPMTNRERADLYDILAPKDQEAIAEAAMLMVSAEWLEENPTSPFAAGIEKTPNELRLEARSWRYRGNYGMPGHNR